MKVLITGGAGFIGSNLTKHLFENTDYSIYIVDNLSNGNYHNIGKYLQSNRVFFKKIDIRSEEFFNYCVKICPNIIYHMAAKVSVPLSFESPREYFDANVIGTQNCLEVAKVCSSKLVFSSSSSVYGNRNDQANENDSLHPISPYALSKKIGEEMCLFYNKVYGVETCILRYFNVYGPNQQCSSAYSGVLSLFCNHKTKGKLPVIYGDGSQSRDFTYVDDIVKVNYLVSKKILSGQIFNAAPGESTSLNMILKKLEIPNAVYKDKRDGDISYSCSDSSALKKFINYSFKYDIDRGLKKYLKHLNDKLLEKNR